MEIDLHMSRNYNGTTVKIAKQSFNAIVAGLIVALALKVIAVMYDLDMLSYPPMIILFCVTAVLGQLSISDYSTTSFVLSIGWGTSWGILLVWFHLEFIIEIFTFAFITLILVYYESHRTNETRV